MTTPPRIDAPHSIPRTAGHTGNVWSQDYDPKAEDAQGSYGVAGPDARPAVRDAETQKQPNGDAQTGAAPLRDTRYADAHAQPAHQDTIDEETNPDRPGFETPESQSHLPGKGKDERGNYGATTSEPTQPEP